MHTPMSAPMSAPMSTPMHPESQRDALAENGHAERLLSEPPAASPPGPLPQAAPAPRPPVVDLPPAPSDLSLILSDVVARASGAATDLRSKEEGAPLDPAELRAGGPLLLAGQLLRRRAALSRLIVGGAHDAVMRRDLTVVAAGGAGLYGAAVAVAGGPLQMLAGAVKLPLVMLGAAALSLPVLWLSARMFDAKLGVSALGALVLQALATAALVMAGLAPIVAVWWLSVQGGEVQGLDALADSQALEASWRAYRRVVLGGLMVAAAGGAMGAARLSGSVPLRAAAPWSATLALCALQLAWLLRPLVGNPETDALLQPVERDGLWAALRAIGAVLGVPMAEAL